MEEPLCRICMGDASEGKLFSPCLCKGSMRYVHVECLQRWRKEKDKAPSYYRCDQCHYKYNLQRIAAAGFLGNRWVLELITALLLCATTVAAAVVSSRVLPTSEVLDTQSWSGSIMSGLLLVGIVSFCCSSLLPCCRSQRQQISACPNHCFHCRGWNGLYLGAEMGEVMGVVFVLILAYVALVGIVRAVVFVYTTFKALAQGGSDFLETRVLDIGEAPPSSNSKESLAGDVENALQPSSSTREHAPEGDSSAAELFSGARPHVV